MAADSQQSTKRINHQWTAEEDKVLVECLSDLGLCWKGDNDFKAGYSNVVEKMMHNKIPGCNLRASPHITSRVKLLKKQYNAIAEMVGHNGESGFGWNDTKKMIDVERQIFDDWAKSHPSAKGLYNKPFPHYDILGTIFGKDVATGSHSVGADDVIREMERDPAMYDDSGTPFDDYLDISGDYIPTHLEDPPMPDIPAEEVVQPSSPVSTASARKGKKRKKSEDPFSVEMVDVMKDLTQVYRKSTDNIDKLVSCFQHQADGSNRRMSIMDEIEKFDYLPSPQMVHIGVQFGRDRDLTDIFMQCSEEKKKQILAGMLDNFDK
ncbi:uncharacterized protein LOC133284024 [Gastrolobium bilobum]|uniref:uncharacterized protein LOC133284024 n=1 Tax=Gastrolobium bilobum TaxID=150636 RepID=UPI002AAF8470|nr:uncharacterized protein LOC133284024 [Gastrolobium bilobum]